MQTLDDEQFESYLKRFQPIAPKPIKGLGVAETPRRWFAPAASITALAATFIVAVILWHTGNNRVAVRSAAHKEMFVDRHALLEPLTTRTADAWLATAPSFQAAVDDLAFRSGTTPIPQGQESALAVLSREEASHAALQ